MGESVGREQGVFGVSNYYRKHQLPPLPYTKKGFNEQLHVPVEIHAVMKAALFRFLFIPLSPPSDLTFIIPSKAQKLQQPPPLICWVYFGWSLNQSLACAGSKYH